MMGSGIGGNIGGPQEPTIEQMQASASVEVAKQMSGIMRDSLDVVFTQLGGNLWRYQSDSGHPVLHPMATFRIDMGKEKALSSELQKTFEALAKMLTPGIYKRLTMDMERPMQARNSSMRALEEVLYGAARAVVTLKGAMQPQEASSAAALRHIQYLQLPERGLAGAKSYSGELSQLIGDMLEQEGAAMFHFDECQAGAKELLYWNKLLGAVAKGDKGALGEEWAGLQGTLQALDRLPRGAPMQMIRSALVAMQPIIAAQMAGVEAPSLLIALWMAFCGSAGGEEPAAANHFSLTGAAGLLAATLAQILFPRGSNPGQQLLLRLIIQAALTLAASTGALMAEASLPAGVDAEKEPLYRPFTMELAMALLTRGAVLETVFAQALASMQAEKQGAKLSSKALAKAAKMAMLLAAAKKKKREKITEAIIPYFEEDEQTMDELLRQLGEGGKISDRSQAAFYRALFQEHLAVMQGDADSFVAAWGDCAAFFGGDWELLEGDIGKVGEGAVRASKMIAGSQARDSNYQTALVQPA